MGSIRLVVCHSQMDYGLVYICSAHNNVTRTSLIDGRHVEDSLTQYEAVRTTLCTCSESNFPSSSGSASSVMFPDSIRGFACTHVSHFNDMRSFNLVFETDLKRESKIKTRNWVCLWVTFCYWDSIYDRLNCWILK
jgi:hypothetical protein